MKNKTVGNNSVYHELVNIGVSPFFLKLDLIFLGLGSILFLGIET